MKVNNEGKRMDLGQADHAFLQYYFEFKFVLPSRTDIYADAYFRSYKADPFQKLLNLNYLVLNCVHNDLFFLVKPCEIGAHF